MLVAIRWISNIALIGALLSCAGPYKREYQGPAEEVYQADFDATWRAAQKAMLDYPLKVNNIDAGIIETDNIRGQEIWRPPFKTKKSNPGLRYSMKLVATQGAAGAQKATKIRIYKKTSLEKDFFSGKDEINSDGFEEERILYRIRRELQIEKALDKAYKNNQI